MGSSSNALTFHHKFLTRCTVLSPSTPGFEGFKEGESTVHLVRNLWWKVKALEEDGERVRKRMTCLEEENKGMKETIVKLLEEVKGMREEGGKLREENVALKEESVNLRDQIKSDMSEVKKINEDMKTVVNKVEGGQADGEGAIPGSETGK